MRLGHKIVQRGSHGVGVDGTVAEFSEGMHYRDTIRGFATPEAFVRHFENQSWVAELNAELCRMIDRDRKIFGIGSGLGEHEILLSQAGYCVTASDVVDTKDLGMGRLFPSNDFVIFDVFTDDLPRHADTLLVTGMDSYFDGLAFEHLMARLAQLLRSIPSDSPSNYAPELVFTCRYPNNFATWMVDVLVLPFECALLNVRARIRRRPERWHRKAHGYRRSTREVISEASRWGLEVQSISFAGLGMEAQRSFLVASSNSLKEWISAWDRRGVLANCRILTFRSTPVM